VRDAVTTGEGDEAVEGDNAPLSSEDGARLAGILSPHSAEIMRKATAAESRFVYYTTAETAMSILRNKEVWMRSTRVMNDYMEVEHGRQCLETAYQGKSGSEFDEALEECFPGLASELRKQVGAWLPDFYGGTYMTCLSSEEHA
jgi:hypothetical protein